MAVGTQSQIKKQSQITRSDSEQRQIYIEEVLQIIDPKVSIMQASEPTDDYSIKICHQNDQQVRMNYLSKLFQTPRKVDEYTIQILH